MSVVCLLVCFFPMGESYQTSCLEISGGSSFKQKLKVLVPFANNKKYHTNGKCRFLPFFCCRQNFNQTEPKCYRARILGLSIGLVLLTRHKHRPLVSDFTRAKCRCVLQSRNFPPNRVKMLSSENSEASD